MSALGQKQTFEATSYLLVSHTCKVISQTRPSARQSKCVFPDRWAIICSITQRPRTVCQNASGTKHRPNDRLVRLNFATTKFHRRNSHAPTP